MPRGGKRIGAGRKPDPPEVKEAKRLARNVVKAERQRALHAAAKRGEPLPVAPARKAAQVVPLRVAAAANPEKPPVDVADEVRAANASMSPLDYCLMVMRDPRAETARRDRMALRALDVLHPPAKSASAPFAAPSADDAPGKRAEQQRAASAVAGGSRLRPLAPPPGVGGLTPKT
jgi:hypothetical protein